MLTLTKAAGILLMPPGIVIILALIGLLLLLRWRLAGAALLTASIAALYVLSLPVTGIALLGRLEAQVPALPVIDAALGARAGAIVVLGGGRHIDSPEYGGDTVNTSTLERLRYAARLHRATGLPVLVSGGSVFGESIPEAELMQRVMREDLGVSATWVEGRSRTTYENALYSRAILEAAGITRVLLVTHAWHMPRAIWAFRQAGLDVLMAPTSFSRGYRSHSGLDWLPSARGLLHASRALHEQLGLLWYRLRYGSNSMVYPAAASVSSFMVVSAKTLPARPGSARARRGAYRKDQCRKSWLPSRVNPTK